MKIPPIVYSILLVLLALVWVTYCLDPSARKDALQAQQDTKDDSVRANHDRWKADFMRRDSARDDSLARLNGGIQRARGEIARLKARITPPGGRPAEPQPASTNAEEPVGKTAGEAESAPPVDSLLAQLAVRDTIIAEQDTTIAQLDSTVTIWQAMSADRDDRIAQLEAESAAYRTSRDAWKKTATRKGLHIRPCGATILQTNGHPAMGVGLCMTWG